MKPITLHELGYTIEPGQRFYTYWVNLSIMAHAFTIGLVNMDVQDHTLSGEVQWMNLIQRLTVAIRGYKI